MSVIGKAGDGILEGASGLPGGYFVKKLAEGYRLMRLDPASSSVIGCAMYPSPGEAYEGYVKAFALELALDAPFVDKGNAEAALREAERLVRDMADHWKGGDRDGG